MPNTRLPLRLPVALLAHHPLQVGVTRATLPTNPPALHLRKVALEEINLVLPIDTRGIGILSHHAKVIEHLPARNRRLGLRDQLRALHAIRVPYRCVVDGGAQSLRLACICWVLVRCVESEVV